MRRPPPTLARSGPGMTRRQMLQALGLAGLGAAVLPSLAACAPGRKADGVVQFATGNDPVWVEYIRAAAEAFEAENPGVRIDLSFIPESALDPWLVARTAAGQAPDIVELGVSAVSRYSRNGTAVDIAPYIEANTPDQYLPVVAALIAREGAVYGIPKTSACATTYYHRDIVEQIGARIPTSADDGWTPDEFYDMCVEAQAITGAYGTSWGYVNANSGNRWLATVYSRGGALFDANGEPSMQSNEALDALEWTQRMYAERLISPSNTVKASQPDTAATLFTTRQVGFMVHESQANVLRQTLDDDEWGLTYMMADERTATNLSGSVNIVTSSSPQPELAARFLQFASQPEYSLGAIRDSGTLSPFAGIDASEVGYEYKPEDMSIIEQQLAGVPEAVGVDMSTRDYQTVREVLGDSLDLLMIGSQSPEETAAMIDRGIANA